jgi:pimeloyl-ACP methyl ester carboxylesterase
MIVVLVHGAWHGAWCWARVLDLLAAEGIEAEPIKAVAVDLPLTGLPDDATHVREMLDSLDGPVLLVGHSYGGAVITEAGDHPSVARLLYLAAFPLEENESAASAASADPATAQISHDGRPELRSGLIFDEAGLMSIDRDVAAAMFYNDCDAESTAWALDRLRPQALASLQQQPAAVAWRSRPSTYVVCADDRTVHPELQRILARRGAVADGSFAVPVAAGAGREPAHRAGPIVLTDPSDQPTAARSAFSTAMTAGVGSLRASRYSTPNRRPPSPSADSVCTSAGSGATASASSGMNAPANPAETSARAAVNSRQEWAGGKASPVLRRIRRNVWATAEPGGASTHGRCPTSANEITPFAGTQAAGTTIRYGSSSNDS